MAGPRYPTSRRLPALHLSRRNEGGGTGPAPGIGGPPSVRGLARDPPCPTVPGAGAEPQGPAPACTGAGLLLTCRYACAMRTPSPLTRSWQWRTRQPRQWPSQSSAGLLRLPVLVVFDHYRVGLGV